MLPELPATSTATNHFYSLVDRVLHLRRQLGIDIALSLRDTEDIHLSPRGFQGSSRKMLKHASPGYDRRDWLTWSQSPGEGKMSEKDQEERF